MEKTKASIGYNFSLLNHLVNHLSTQLNAETKNQVLKIHKNIVPTLKLCLLQIENQRLP